MFKKSKHKNAPKGGFKLAFSLVELMISLIVVSVVAATFAPVVSKKMQSNTISAGGSGLNIIKSDCEKFNSNGGNCHTCFNSACIVCEYDNCDGYLNVGKCQCESCTLRSANCVKCNSKECTKCKENYYLDSNKKCQSCSSGKYCSGNSSPMECSKINSNCKTCSSSSTCTKCNSGYYLNSAKTSCTKCEAGNYCNGQTKTACADKTYAAAGASGCSAVTNVTNCVTYSQTSNACSKCNSGYYLSNNTCTKCPKGSYCNGSTKTTCPDGQYTDTEGNSSCQTCPAGYYCKNGTKTACGNKQYSSSGASSCSSSTNVNNCSKYSTSENKCDTCKDGYILNGNQCEKITEVQNCETYSKTENKCESCSSGYKLSNNTCVSDFDCSGQYFMKIGSLCVTKYNMGDSTETAIPSAAGVSVVGVGMSCGSSSITSKEKCCWQGKTSGDCDDKYNIYSGCYRTVCNIYAADAICSNFKLGGKTWRLPTSAELENWYSVYSKNKGSSGLMLCDCRSNNFSIRCEASESNCSGAYEGNCRPYVVWSSINNLFNSTYSYAFYLYSNEWYGRGSGVSNFAYSTRCVTEM